MLGESIIGYIKPASVFDLGKAWAIFYNLINDYHWHSDPETNQSTMKIRKQS